MLSLISPAKSQNFKDKAQVLEFSLPLFEKEIGQLVKIASKLSPDEISTLMSISDKLSHDVWQMYHQFEKNFTLKNAKQALFAFNGDVYRSLNAHSLKPKEVEFAQSHLMIISGLYGLLRPLDLMQSYRLEMGLKLDISGKNLYQFWQEKLTSYLNDVLENHKNKIVINLASQEYKKAINHKKINAIWIDVDFKEYRSGKYKTIGILAKRARGLMARFIIENKIDNLNGIKKFDVDGYFLNQKLSKENHFVFSRKEI